MKITLLLVGAGEFTSFDSVSTEAYLRFRTADGSEFNMGCTEDQVRLVLQFASEHSEGGTPPATQPPLVENETEDDEKIVQLHQLPRSPSPFVTPDDDNSL